MRASTFTKSGFEPGKTKIDINSNSNYYETYDQWAKRLKADGRDSSSADYDKEQNDEYFKRNPVK